MFLCKECLKNYLVETVRGFEPLTDSTLDGITISYGSCEDCHETKFCYDIHHLSIAHKYSEYANRNRFSGTVTVGEVDRILFGCRKRVTYSRDEHNYFSVTGENGELLTFFPIASGRSGYRVIFSDFDDLSAKSVEATFKKESEAAEFFYDLLRKLCN